MQPAPQAQPSNCNHSSTPNHPEPLSPTAARETSPSPPISSPRRVNSPSPSLTSERQAWSSQSQHSLESGTLPLTADDLQAPSGSETNSKCSSPAQNNKLDRKSSPSLTNRLAGSPPIALTSANLQSWSGSDTESLAQHSSTSTSSMTSFHEVHEILNFNKIFYNDKAAGERGQKLIEQVSATLNNFRKSTMSSEDASDLKDGMQDCYLQRAQLSLLSLGHAY